MDALCRLCMKDGADLIPVLDKNRTNKEYNVDSYEVIVKKINFCLELTVSHEDDLTKSICLSCIESLNKFCEFKRKSKGAQEFLKKYRILEPLTTQINFKNEATSAEAADARGFQSQKEEIISPVKEAPLVPVSASKLSVKEASLVSVSASKLSVKETPLVSDSPSTLLVEVRNESRFECNTCGEMFASETARDDHRNIVHAPKDSSRCELCSKICKNLNGLKTHILRAHYRSKPNKNSEISERSSNSPTRRPRSRSRSCSVSTERSRDSVQRENPEINIIAPPPTIADNNDTDSGILHKELRVVLQRLNPSVINAYKRARSPESFLNSNHNADDFGPPPVLTPIKLRDTGGEISNHTISKKSKQNIEEQEISCLPNKRTRRKTIVYNFDEEDEDFVDDDVDDPPYAPTDQNVTQDYMVDVEVVEEMDHDSFDGSNDYDPDAALIALKRNDEKKKSIVSPKEATSLAAESNDNITNGMKRKADSTDDLDCFNRKLAIFNLRMADQSELPFRVNVKFTENAGIINHSAVKVMQQESAKEDPGGDALTKRFKTLMYEDLQEWLSQLYIKFSKGGCPFMVEDDVELEVTEIENGEKVENEGTNVSCLTPTMLNQPINQLEILLSPGNSAANENSADSVNVPFIRVKNPKELGIVSPRQGMPIWPHDYESNVQNDHTYPNL